MRQQVPPLGAFQFPEDSTHAATDFAVVPRADPYGIDGHLRIRAAGARLTGDAERLATRTSRAATASTTDRSPR
jgi:hypothetical protein